MKRAQPHLLNLLIALPLLLATTSPLAGQQAEGTRGNWALAERFNSESISRFIHSTNG